MKKHIDKVVLTIGCNRTAAISILPLLKELKSMGQVGCSREIKIEDWDGKNKFGFDGDGPDSIDTIELDGELVKSKAAINHLKKEGRHKHGDSLKVDPKQLALGIKIEMEHTSSKDVAREIALDHLHEDSKYYTHLSEMEDKHVKKSLMEGGMKTKFALVIVPGEIEPLEKGKGHPACLSNPGGKTKSGIPYEGHAERIAFTKMAATRMIGSSAPESSKANSSPKRVDGKGRVKGEKKPHKNYSTSVSGSSSQAHNNFGRKTYIVRPEDIGSSAPESASKHQPSKVRKPKS